MQTSFLRQVAALYYAEEANHLGRYAFVFPNKRAGIFFKKYLSEVATTTVFAPRVFSVNEFLGQYTDYRLEQRIPLLFRLFECYKARCGASDAKFDAFVSLGEALLTDFDEIMKYGVDADLLFSNVLEEKHIEAMFDYLTEEQKEVIKRFFSQLNKSKSYDRNFLGLWEQLAGIYHEFNALLEQERIGYEGLVYSKAIDCIEQQAQPLAFERVVFVGFNALNRIEERLFTHLKKEQLADFYWDVQLPYAVPLTGERNSLLNAFEVVRRNSLRYPSRYKMPEMPQVAKAAMELIPVPSNIGQVKCAHDVLQQLLLTDAEARKSPLRNVVVLPDEKLLLPMLSSLPEVDGVHYNVTMGYPLGVSVLHSFVTKLLETKIALHKPSMGVEEIETRHFLPVVQHHFMRLVVGETIDELLAEVGEKKLVTIVADNISDEILKSLYTFLVCDNVGVLTDLIDLLTAIQQKVEQVGMQIERACVVAYIDILAQLNRYIGVADGLSLEVLAYLLKQLINSEKIPFKGEPLDGVQVMGFLESRSLDFENVIMLSMNEGTLPKTQPSHSLIPYSLRKGYGLPTFEQHDAFASYYFYRLIARAKRLYFVYDNRVEESGEMSRFVHQLKYLFKMPMNEMTLAANVRLERRGGRLVVKKTPEIMQALAERELSASALKVYMHCPLRFYLEKVEGISYTELQLNDIAESTFGTIFHRAMELLYKPWEGREVTAADLAAIADTIPEVCAQAFRDECFGLGSTRKIVRGRDLLVVDVVQKYVRSVFEDDKKKGIFKVVGLEASVRCEVPLSDGRRVRFKGNIDRIVRVGDRLQVLDYKTGSDDNAFRSVDKLFEGDRGAIFQTLMYSMMLIKEDNPERMEGVAEIEPHICRVRKMRSDDASTAITLGVGSRRASVLYSDVSEEYEAAFVALLEGLFSNEGEFAQCDEKRGKKACKYCKFKAICGRNNGEFDSNF